MALNLVKIYSDGKLNYLAINIITILITKPSASCEKLGVLGRIYALSIEVL